MKKMNALYICCIVSIWSSAIFAEDEMIQTFTLHGDERCQDVGESYSDNVRNLGKVSNLVQTKGLRCACTDFGVWTYSPRINYYGGEFGGSHLAVTKMESDKTCVTLGKNSSILSIRKAGHAKVNLPAASFYVDVSLRGRELYFDGTCLDLPWPILFRSVGFTGSNASWALYQSTDASGPLMCMGQKESTLITYSSGTKMNLIGSIRQSGCFYPSGEAKPAEDDDSSTDDSPPSLQLILRDRSKQVSTDANELRLPYPITVYSFSFNGDANWTIYRGVLFNGRAKCLYSAGSGESGAQNFMDDAGAYPIGSLVIGSVKKGCHVNTAETEDYPVDNDDIYDYEDGYGKVASGCGSSLSEAMMTSWIVLIATSIRTLW